MSDPVTATDQEPRYGADVTQLRERLAELVLAVPGVLRIEPTLAGLTLRRGPDHPGRHLQLSTRRGLTDVAVHVAVGADQPARLLAHRLRAVLLDELHRLELVAGTVDVAVLTIEPV